MIDSDSGEEMHEIEIRHPGYDGGRVLTEVAESMNDVEWDNEASTLYLPNDEILREVKTRLNQQETDAANSRQYSAAEQIVEVTHKIPSSVAHT